MTAPAIIQPHLIPFIYEEFSGDGEAFETNELSKDILLYKSGSIGQIIFRVLDDLTRNNKIYLKIQVVPGHLKSHAYAFLSFDNKEPAMVPMRDIKMINDLLEDIMSTALVFYVLGNLIGKETSDKVQSSIESFMKRYNLYDFEFNIQQLRMMYYRAKRKRPFSLGSRSKKRHKESSP